ncbi:hypothetical protein QCA50_013868 [Cerrena zonata]|uniref:glutathione transferase n=1 Tax=Cerrena zonata TaxID=2478898 RepID=A0AAW0FWB6_9APHY
MSHGKQFTLYSHYGGPNGWKVAHVLDELKLTYETVYLKFDKQEQKGPEFTKLNPNGRIPALVDHHNNDFVIWESDAIILYVADKYDKEKRISAANEAEKYQIIQWLFFQASGQGPYYGQFFWFFKYHPEKFPSAIDRYKDEILRIFGVLENVLSKQQWLVGNKMTIADLSFVVWNFAAVGAIKDYKGEFDLEKEFPRMAAWHAKLEALPSVKKAIDARTALVKQQ